MDGFGKNNSKKTNFLFIAAWIALTWVPPLIYSSCKENLSDSNETNGAAADNRVVIAWNELAYKIANEHDQFYTFKGVRALAMAHIAMHDAVNAVIPKYEHYAFNTVELKADPVAAASYAAFEVLVSVYPLRKDTLQIILDEIISEIPEGEAKNLGIDLGKKSAYAVIQKRQADGYDTEEDYTPKSNPGDYQFTPGFDWVISPGFRHAKPFGLTSADQFRASPPPDLTSTEYENSYNEVKNYGVKGSTIRNQDQTNYAYWWAEFAEHSLNRIGRLTSVDRKLSLHETARMFALINITLYDIYLAVVDSKYSFDRWRPITAIRSGDNDDNPNTEPDTSWVPEMLTPPWPEYPSAHASCIAGGFEIFKHVYGSANLSFTMESITALPDNKIRSYDNLEAAANECADSRVMNGFHFRFATEVGKNQGRKVAKYIIANLLRIK